MEKTASSTRRLHQRRAKKGPVFLVDSDESESLNDLEEDEGEDDDEDENEMAGVVAIEAKDSDQEDKREEDVGQGRRRLPARRARRVKSYVALQPNDDAEEEEEEVGEEEAEEEEEESVREDTDEDGLSGWLTRQDQHPDIDLEVLSMMVTI